MKTKHLIILALIFVMVALTLTSCGGENDPLEGKNIVTFKLNEGTLDYKTSITKTDIKFGYEPGTYILDPSTIPNYKLYRNGYNFTGWYTDASCAPATKWDFKTPFNSESLTLYAGWVKAVVHSFSVCYADGEEDVVLGQYSVTEGDTFDDWRGFSEKRKGYTAIGFYSDRELTTLWDTATAHPGGEGDCDVKVYVDYIEGEWELVDNFAMLNSALKYGKNVYLTADIDAEGADLQISSYNGTFNGNGYKVSGFNVPESGPGISNPICVIFTTLGENAYIKDVTFENVTFDFTGIDENARVLAVAAIAQTSNGAAVENVSVSGVLTTNYAGELPKLNEAFFEEAAESTVENFSATIEIVVTP